MGGRGGRSPDSARLRWRWTLIVLVVLVICALRVAHTDAKASACACDNGAVKKGRRACPDKFNNYPVCNKQGKGCTRAEGFFVVKEGIIERLKMKDGPNKCCAACASDPACFYWTWIEGRGKNTCEKYFDALLCEAFKKSWLPRGSGCKSKWVSGGHCGPVGNDDPHFVGADGVHFDFSGQPGADFCLVADHHLHINMHLSGYVDTVERVEHAAAGVDASEDYVARVSNVTRTWIRALGIRYGPHAIVLEARSDGNPERLDGYMSKIEVDGESVKLTPGAERRFEDGIRVMQTNVTHFSGYEQDNFVLSIEGVLDVTLRLRSAGAQWQRRDDAQTHFNVNIRQLSHSDDIHGVLGQTYRRQWKREATGRSYELVKGFRGEMQVEGPNGDGYLDGDLNDYRTTGLLATDCKFAIFQDDAGRSQFMSTTNMNVSSYGVSLMTGRRL